LRGRRVALILGLVATGLLLGFMSQVLSSGSDEIDMALPLHQLDQFVEPSGATSLPARVGHCEEGSSPFAERRFTAHTSPRGVADDLASQAVELGWTPARGQPGAFQRDGQLLVVGLWDEGDESGQIAEGVLLAVLVRGDCG
jgi:hypothetical protein